MMFATKESALRSTIRTPPSSPPKISTPFELPEMATDLHSSFVEEMHNSFVQEMHAMQRRQVLSPDSESTDIGYASQFITSRGNEYFCEIDEDYLTDRFNLTGLNAEVQYYQYALDLVTDVFDLDCDEDMRDQIEKSARHLYGLVHARYITTIRGLAKMVRRFHLPSYLS